MSWPKIIRTVELYPKRLKSFQLKINSVGCVMQFSNVSSSTQNRSRGERLTESIEILVVMLCTRPKIWEQIFVHALF